MNTSTNLFNELQERGFIYQHSDQNMPEILEKEKMTLYVGTDPTADSLHIWHLVPMLMLSHFKRFWHRPILLVWWATGMIGDPSFKNKERVLLTNEMVQYNLSRITEQLNRILNNDPWTSVEVVNNYDWFKEINILDFLRDTGKYFSVNTMLARDSVKSRIENENEGMSFTEFSYALLQSYDFLHLNQEMWCNLQIGWSDQWGNIVSGIDLVKKRTGNTVYGITCPLVTKADGTKFWKTEGGNVWLDAWKTSPYKFYQFWFNVSDEDAKRFIKLYTFLSLEEINHLIQLSEEKPEKRILQRKIAQEVTKMIHGWDTLQRVLQASRILFEDDWSVTSIDESVATILSGELTNVQILSGEFSLENLIEQLVKSGVFTSKWEVRKLLTWNSLSINGKLLQDFDFSNRDEKHYLLRKWKKNHYLISLIP